ncbi:MAG: hypothetical protein HOY69_10290, partial [Streptomyces sp.]|nr:hypothetical protein [Streptomyces sp.]
MRRRTVSAGSLEEILEATAPLARTPEQADHTGAAAPAAAPAPAARRQQALRDEFEFELPRGYVDD